jgi:hypothetical protein
MDEMLGSSTFWLFAWLTITSVVSSVAYYWYKARKAELEASLKQQMIERGMSAEEIVKVLRGSAAPDKPDAGTSASPGDSADYKSAS